MSWHANSTAGASLSRTSNDRLLSLFHSINNSTVSIADSSLERPAEIVILASGFIALGNSAQPANLASTFLADIFFLLVLGTARQLLQLSLPVSFANTRSYRSGFSS